MGTSASSSSPWLITVTGKQGGGQGTSLGGFADVYAPPAGGMGTGLLSGGMMGFDQDSGIPSDAVDPSKAPKADMTQEEYDELIAKTDAIRNGTLSDEAKRAAISEKLTEAGIAHDPNTLDLKSNSDQSGLINKRINIIDPTAGGGAEPSSGQSPLFQGAVQAIEDALGGDSSAAAVSQAVAADAAAMAGDADLEGSVDTIAADIEGATAAGGLQVGDIVTDDRISGDYSFVYDAEQNVFHYTPFDAAGNRIYTGETIDASTVTGWSGTTTGETASILFDGDTPYIETQATTDNGDTDGKIDITVNTTGASGADVANVILDTTTGTSDLTTGTSIITDSITDDGANTTVVTGTKGDAGDKGDTGDKGDKGDSGDKGDKGDVGDKGDKGDVGDKGDKGDTGDKGDKGDAGDKGDKGDKGDTGLTGDKGDAGDKGDKGDTGDKGDKGDAGDKGDKGDKGDTGAAGQDGKDGSDGVDGVDGIDGVDGVDGADGAAGKDGKDGKDGEKGERGAAGVAGLSAPFAQALFGDEFQIRDVLDPKFIGLLNLRGRR